MHNDIKSGIKNNKSELMFKYSDTLFHRIRCQMLNWKTKYSPHKGDYHKWAEYNQRYSKG